MTVTRASPSTPSKPVPASSGCGAPTLSSARDRSSSTATLPEGIRPMLAARPVDPVALPLPPHDDRPALGVHDDRRTVIDHLAEPGREGGYGEMLRFVGEDVSPQLGDLAL